MTENTQSRQLAVELSGITLRREGQIVLDNVSLEIREGLTYAIIGPNGGGKTTLIKIILGLVKPDSGTIKVYGESQKVNRYMIGYVPQFHTFDFGYPITVREMVLSGRLGHIKGQFKKYSPNDIRIANESMELLGISELSERTLDELSGGEQQRAIIARSIVGEPKILLLDEPTVYVDSPTEEKLQKILSDLSKRMTIVMVTHDIGVISTGVDVVVCLNKKLYTHYNEQITNDMLLAAYKCPVDLIAHGLSHRVLSEHDHLDNEGGISND